MRGVIVLFLLLLAGCVSKTSPQQFSTDCRAEATTEQLLAANWLQQTDVWRLHQSALLELGPKKLPLEGFLRLDLQQRQARLLAMNEMGLVLFDLQVDENDQQLRRAVPQLQQVKGFAEGVAQSLRQIFLQPRPQVDDQLKNRGNSQQLWRSQTDGNLSFIFDCRGDLRETRHVGESGDWRVFYDQYRDYPSTRLPEKIIFNNYSHGVKLSLWTRKVKQEP